MKPANLVYTFVSYAAHYDTEWGKGVAIEGINRTAELAHRYGIPVTWIVNGRSVPVLAERIRDWHEKFGDDVILQSPFFIEDTGASKAAFRQALESDQLGYASAMSMLLLLGNLAIALVYLRLLRRRA